MQIPSQTPKYRLKPYVFVIRTTERCNVGCAHCSISANKTGVDIETDLVCSAIAEAASYGVTRIHLSGGEPLLNPDLPRFVQEANRLGLIAGLTSSVFTRQGEDNRPLLSALSASGVGYVMLSYDDFHARRISLKQFTGFVKAAQEQEIDVCVFIIERPGGVVSHASVAKACREVGVDVDAIDWTVTDFQYIGRAKRYEGEDLSAREKGQLAERCYPRCPIVLSAATLNPDGRVYLCNCSRFDAGHFTLGRYPDEPLPDILARMEQSPIYRYLAKYGPQQALVNLDQREIPADMCAACERYLLLMDEPIQAQRLIDLANDDQLTDIPVDYEALLPIYKKHMDKVGEEIRT